MRKWIIHLYLDEKDERKEIEEKTTTLELNIGFVLDFGPTKIGNVSDVGGNTINLQ